MRIGTKSILFGAHAFWMHPWFVALAWWKLYGFPFDPRLWVAFFVHDIGYWGKPNMDGAEGEQHPLKGAIIMSYLFGHKWGVFTLFHSRFYAKSVGAKHSRLCAADKLATSLTPRWLYIPMASATGEIDEYMSLAGVGKYQSDKLTEMAMLRQSGGLNKSSWHRVMTNYMAEWAYANK